MKLQNIAHIRDSWSHTFHNYRSLIWFLLLNLISSIYIITKRTKPIIDQSDWCWCLLKLSIIIVAMNKGKCFITVLGIWFFIITYRSTYLMFYVWKVRIENSYINKIMSVENSRCIIWLVFLSAAIIVVHIRNIGKREKLFQCSH